MSSAIAAHAAKIGEIIAAHAHDALRAIDEATQAAMRRIESSATVSEYDYKAAAAYLSLPRRTLERRVQQRRLTFRRDGRRILFTKAALDEYRARGERPARVRPPVQL